MAMKVCLTPEMAARNEVPRQTEGDCTTTITSRSASGMKMNFVCTNPPSKGEGTYTFSGDKAYTAHMAIQSTRNGKPETTTIQRQRQMAECRMRLCHAHGCAQSSQKIVESSRLRVRNRRVQLMEGTFSPREIPGCPPGFFNLPDVPGAKRRVPVRV
jgi:hypothetical protein